MRQVATIPDEASAKRLADYLLTLDITTRIIPEKAGSGVWVHREEKVEQARAESAEFLVNPGDPKYQGTAKAAEAARRELARMERLHRRNTINLQGRLNIPSARRCPITYGLIGISLAVAALTWLGENREADEPFFFSKFIVVFEKSTMVVPDSDGRPRDVTVPMAIRARQAWTRSAVGKSGGSSRPSSSISGSCTWSST